MILGDIKKAKWGRRKGVLRNSSCQAHLNRRHYNQDLNEIKKKKKALCIPRGVAWLTGRQQVHDLEAGMCLVHLRFLVRLV